MRTRNHYLATGIDKNETAVLAYFHNWDVLRMMYQHALLVHHGVMSHQQSVGQPATYVLVATASEANGAPNGTAKPNS